MKAILMAAGRGTRISRLIEDIPKSTLPVNGLPLIRITVQMLLAHGMEIAVCVGYRAEDVYKSLDGLPVKYYFNPFFDVTNSIASLWFAKEELVGETLLMNADVFFQNDVLDIALQSRHDAAMLVDKSRVSMGDYFFRTTANGCIEKYGKELPLSERSAEYVGVAKISAGFVGEFKERMDLLIDTGQYGRWWENVLYSYADSGDRDIFTLDVDGRFWAEIDYFDDYERILNYISSIGEN
jgi:choline kinase